MIPKTIFRCPKCSQQTEGRFEEVAHRCPNNRNRMTNFKKVDE